MRDLFDRLGCLVQAGIGVAAFVALDRWTALPTWGAVGAAAAASYLGTFVLAAALSRER